MLLVHRDDVVEKLSSATSYPAFGDTVLPRCMNARALRSKSGCFKEFNHTGVEFRVVVEDHIPISSGLRKGFA